jgi:hypothetical protein
VELVAGFWVLLEAARVSHPEELHIFPLILSKYVLSIIKAVPAEMCFEYASYYEYKK